MKYTSYKNSVRIEGNLYHDPVFNFDEDEGCDCCRLTLASVFYPNNDEKEVTYVTVLVYIERLRNFMSDYGHKGSRIRVVGRLSNRGGVRSPNPDSMLLVIADEIEFAPK